MSTQKKPNGVPQAATGLLRIALVGGSSLKGKEVVEVLDEAYKK